jgi:tetratricopeptide (TPR) repeat protein
MTSLMASKAGGARQVRADRQSGWARGPIVVALGLVALTLGVYAGVCRSSFMNYDDSIYVTANRQVQGGLSLPGLRWACTSFDAANWHPLTWLSLQLDASLYGLCPFGFHLTNILLHAASTGLLLALLCRLTGRLWPSALVAALFGLHPLHVESVAWVAERKDVLSGFLAFLTLYAYARYTRNPGWVNYGLTTLALALGLMAKPMLVTLPCLFLLLDFWPLGRFPSGPPGGALQPAAKSRITLEKLPWFALAAVSSAVTVHAQNRAWAIRSLEEFPLSIRAGNAVIACVRYLLAAVWPSGLQPFYAHSGQPSAVWILGLCGLLLAIVTMVVLTSARSMPYFLVGWLWYLVTLAPVIGIIQVGMQAMADRYTYLPLVGIFIMASWGAAELAARRRVPARAAAACASVVVAAFAIAAWHQASFWKDGITMWRHALDCEPGSSFAHYNLGSALAKEGRFGEARDEFETALAINDRYAEAHNNLGLVLQKTGQLQAGLGHLRRAVEIAPKNPDAHFNLGQALAQMGMWPQAIDQYSEALRLEPDNALAHLNRGQALAQVGNPADAADEFRAALTIDPQNADASYNLALALSDLGQKAEAIALYKSFLQTHPDDAQGHNNLGQLLEEIGKRTEAIGHYILAITPAPGFALAHGNLALALADAGDQPGALKEANTAVTLQPSAAKFRFDLGHVLYQFGERERAKSNYDQALTQDPRWPAQANEVAWRLATAPQAEFRNAFLAVRLAQQTCEATGFGNADFIDTLAAAQASASNFPEAIALIRKAMAFPGISPELGRAMGRRRALYEAQAPYRETAPGKTKSEGLSH